MAEAKEKKEATKPKPVKKVAAKPKAEKPKAVPKPTPAEAKPAAPAKKGEPAPEKKFVRESVHTINLRNAFSKTRTARAFHAAQEIRSYIRKHTRKEPIIAPSVNELLWARGIQHPPRRIKVKIQEEEKRATAVLA